MTNCIDRYVQAIEMHAKKAVLDDLDKEENPYEPGSPESEIWLSAYRACAQK